MDQEKSESKKRIILIIGLIILLIIVFCGGMLFGRKSAEKRIQIGNRQTFNEVQNEATNEINNTIEKQNKESISDDELYRIYSQMDYSADTEIKQFDTYHIATYDGDDYYVIDGDYEGEYDISFYELSSKVEDRSYEALEKFAINEVMDYSEYAAYCEKWDIEKKYSDEGMNYIVYTTPLLGVGVSEIRLAEVEYKDSIAKLYIWQNSNELRIMTSFIVVIPTHENVEKVEEQHLYTQSSLNYAISRKKYGDDYNGKYNVRITAKKPIIYLYPEEETIVSVKLGYSDKITCSYPKYVNGWNVLAKPNGDLLDVDTNKNLYALYYESEVAQKFKITNDGFVVEGKDTSGFLEEKLAKLGLTEREAEEFIVYWLPKLEQNKYNYIRFATEDEINENMPLDISPKPDSIIRVWMVFKGLDEPIDVLEQDLKTPERKGFVAIEWGGTEIE